jgi:putative phosphonate metabolism protein
MRDEAPGYRYAVYFAPAPETPLWRTGSALLGYDAATGRDVTPLVPDGWSATQWHALTQEPRRYGFHATLKAPFRLRDGVGEARLRTILADLAARQVSFQTPLAVSPIKGFVALAPSGDEGGLRALADAVVDAFEPVRAALTREDIARRRPDRLSPRQRALLDHFGYPYVREEFRFHMTLTGRLTTERPDLVAGLGDILAPVLSSGPVAIDGMALFRQETPQARFRIVARAALT